jgi:hypothetical protein
MKTLRQLCAAFVLALMLAMSALAGDMETGITVPQSPGASSASTPGQMSKGYAGNMSTTSATAIGSATGIALSLVQSMLALI